MMTRRAIISWAGLTALILSGCSRNESAEQTSRWISPMYRDHPLAGRIWKPAESRHATAGEVYTAMKTADFVLIGEKHDNADHHLLQARLVSEMAAYGFRPSLVFEMLTDSQQAPLDAYRAENPGDAAGIGPAVEWKKSGWPNWEMYQPIVQQAVDNELPLLAGGMDRDVIKKIAREGPEALGEGRVTALMLDQPIGEDKRADMRDVIFRSHCEQLPESMLDPLLTVTLAKDAVMAERMVLARGPSKADATVLIAGGGHVRVDWGVPLHLKRRLPDSRIVTVGLLEVDGDASDPADYNELYNGAMPFDFVWFTPRVDDEDPCEAFAEQLQKMREKRLKGNEGESD